MRVIGVEKDFYDPCMAWDEDRSVVYNRTPVEFDTPLAGGCLPSSVDELCLPPINHVNASTREYYWQLGDGILVGWCGRVIPAVNLCIWPKGNVNVPIYDKKSNVFYSVDQIKKACESMLTADPYYLSSWIARAEWWLSSASARQMALLTEWLEHGRVDESRYGKNSCAPRGDWRQDPRFTGLFAKHNAPTWVFEGGRGWVGTLTVNPILSKYGFQSVLDPASAWLELREYVGGVLVNPAGVEPRPISDEIKRDLAGFDNQSFKKGPTKAEKSAKRRKK